jgi:hypothetical protein
MEVLAALRCWYCGSGDIVVSDGQYVCRRCGTVLGPVQQPARPTRPEPMPRKQSISGRLRQITALKRDITWKGLGNSSKANAERGADKDMANYTKRLAKALMETGDFSEEEARALAGAFVRHYRALRYGDGVRGSLPKVDTVIEVLDSITSGKSNMEGGRYDMAIASALRKAFTTTGVYKPLIRRALRLLRIAEPSEDLVELGAKYFEMIYKHLKEEVGGVEPWRYVTSIAIAAAAMAKVEKLGAPLSFVRVELRVRGLENIYEGLKLEKFINNIEWNSVNRETKSQQKR